MMERINSEKLIQAVEEKRAIWDMNCNEYYDKQEKRKEWEEITNLFVTDTTTLEEKKAKGKALQTRWKNLRDRYAKEVKCKTGNKKTPYIHGTQMAFLNEILDLNRSHSHKKEGQNEAVETASTAESLIEKPFGRKRRSDILEERIISALEKRKANKFDDDNFHFMLSLLPTMKNIPEHLKIAFRMEIMQVLQKYTLFPVLPIRQPIGQVIQQTQTHLQNYTAFNIPKMTKIENTRSHSPTPSTNSAGSYLSDYSDGNESETSVF